MTEAQVIAARQREETVIQEMAGVTVRMATITCPCGSNRAVVKTYQCFYCKVWFCHVCAPEHFKIEQKEQP